MTVIWKFRVPHAGQNRIEMPRGAQIASAGCLARDSVYVWALVDPHEPMEARSVWLLPTGGELSAMTGRFIGTVIDGPFVWHVFG